MDCNATEVTFCCINEHLEVLLAILLATFMGGLVAGTNLAQRLARHKGE